ncbi:MAG: peptide ABC transporter substrate-binding protein [bacterium]|nr:peptide ABC transporter substrate-binding protein [bacterium]
MKIRTLWHNAQKRVEMPFIEKAEHTFRSFSESGRALFIFFAGLCVVSTLALVYMLNAQLLVAVPAQGGEVSEGIVGAPRFINPVLAISDADRDLTTLVYSGLLHATAQGDYVPDLAQSYTISSDGKTYTFILRPDATFHDGTPVGADDVVFTIAKTQDAALKSPARANWSGVAVQALDAHTVRFTLTQAYAPFIENLTIGILPKHLWKEVSDDEMPFSDLNQSPVGSGPFTVSSISRTSSGIPSSYTLKAFGRYALGSPYLSGITLHFYQNENALIEALKSDEISAASGISPATLASLHGFTIDSASLNRVFGVFFNQNQSEVLRNSDVRQALNNSVNREALVQQVLGGYGTAVEGPVPPGILQNSSSKQAPAESDDLTAAARNLLLKAGWTPGPDGILQKTTGKGKSAKTVTLQFSLATGNVPELRAAAHYLQTTWKKVGVQVDVRVYDQGDLSQNVIRPRKYDALLFGEVIGRELDLFAFWDSSQRIDPGLNIALYANAVADKILERLRQTSSDGVRQQLYTQFEAQLQRDVPAIFLYAPDFVYIVQNDLRGLDLGFIETPSDRFLSVAQWHLETDYVWPFFTK